MKFESNENVCTEIMETVKEMPAERVKMNKQKLGHPVRRTYISLFSSAGVGCYGFKINGFECIATNELLNTRLAVQKANNKCKYESGYICGDITQQEIQDRLFAEIDMWQRKENLRQVDVVFATPPCQGMSTANYKKNDHEQIRNSLVVQAIKIVKNGFKRGNPLQYSYRP